MAYFRDTAKDTEPHKSVTIASLQVKIKTCDLPDMKKLLYHFEVNYALCTIQHVRYNK
jgi:hypothetical protein